MQREIRLMDLAFHREEKEGLESLVFLYAIRLDIH